MSWKQMLGLSVSALLLAMIAYGLFFAEPRWIEIKIESVRSVRVL